MRLTIHWLAGVTVSTLLFGTFSATSAHHGFTPFFDEQTIMTVKGTVTEVLWVNPHVYLHLAIKEGNSAEEWTVEIGSMSNLIRGGWTREKVKPGDPLTITGWRGKRASNPYLGATIDPAGLPRLLKSNLAEFRDGSRYPTARQTDPSAK
jgi:hypothetical protein